MLRCEHEKLIVEENRFRLDEANRLRLEEENMLQLEEQKKNKRKEFMNSSHGKNILAKLAPAKRNQLGSSLEKINSKVSWVKIKKDRQHVNDPCTAKLLKNVKLWVELLLQKGLPLFYANGERYTTPWSEVDQVQLPVVLERANVFQKKGIDTSKYNITLAHGLSLDVDDHVDVVLAYREKMV
ncbi:hypothetical protein Tco_0127314 [Tanacetum coccineum]